MANRLRPLRVLIPAGVLSGCAVAAWRANQPSEESSSEEGAPDPEPLSTRLSTQLEGVPVVPPAVLRLLLTGLPRAKRGGGIAGYRSKKSSRFWFVASLGYAFHTESK